MDDTTSRFNEVNESDEAPPPERGIAAIPSFPMLLTPIIDEVISEIPADTQHYLKKRATVVAVAMSRAAGIPVDWDRPDLAAPQTWYSKWQNDPLLARLLALLVERVADALEADRMAAIEEAAGVLRAGAPAAARKLVQLVNHHDPAEARLASNSILDRAGKLTAAKGDDRAIHIPALEGAIERIYPSPSPDDAPAGSPLLPADDADDDGALPLPFEPDD